MYIALNVHQQIASLRLKPRAPPQFFINLLVSSLFLSFCRREALALFNFCCNRLSMRDPTESGFLFSVLQTTEVETSELIKDINAPEIRLGEDAISST